MCSQKHPATLLSSGYFSIFSFLEALCFSPPYPQLREHTGNLQPLILPMSFSVHLDISDPLSPSLGLLSSAEAGVKRLRWSH